MEKEEKKEEKKTEKKNNSLAYFILAAVLILLFLFGGLFIYKKLNGTRPMPDWGRKYYNYLSSFSQTAKTTLIENNVQMAETYNAVIYDYAEETNDPPALVLEPIVEENKYLLLVVLVDGEPKEFVIDKEDAKVEMLYNVAEKEYYYYFMYQENGQTHFIKLADYINSLINKDQTYEETVVTNGETITVDGKEVLKVDTLFLEPKVPEIVFEYKPEEVKDLEKNLSYYITDVKETKEKQTTISENGLRTRIDEINKIIVTLESQPKEPEPTPEPEPAPAPEPEPSTPQCEYGMEYVWNDCYDTFQLVKPGGCGYDWEENGICYSHNCMQDGGTIDYSCSEQYPIPGPGECPPGYTNHEGYCFMN
jgi:hypothetical protein